MKRVCCSVLVLSALSLVCCKSSPPMGADNPAIPEQSRIAQVLNDLHAAAAKADGEHYFALFAPEAVFLGTDASERWTIAEFKTYASARFASGHGWTYTPTQRHIVVNDNWATFDELLSNDKYGVCRGSGTLRRIGETWKIVQYDLSIPIPNDMAESITAQIRKHPPLSKPAASASHALPDGGKPAIDLPQS